MLNAHFLFLISHFTVLLEITVLKQVPTHIFSFLNISTIAVPKYTDFRKVKNEFYSRPFFLICNPSEFKGNAIHMFLAISTQIHSSQGSSSLFFFLYESDLMSMKLLKINLGLLLLLLFLRREEVSLDKIKLI